MPEIEEGRFERTAPYLREDEVDSLSDEIFRMEQTLSSPAHVQVALQDRRAMNGRLRKLKAQLDDQSPKAYSETELDAARKRERELREKWTAGMPTGPEMRRNPAGAVDKHMTWEKANKPDILEWKNIQRRLIVSGHVEGAVDIANIERFRPTGGAQELNMHNEQIPGVQYNFPPGGPKVTNGLSDEEYEAIQREKREMQAEIDEMRQLLKEHKRPKQKRAPNEWNRIVGEAKKLGIDIKGKKRPEIEAAIAALTTSTEFPLDDTTPQEPED